MKGTTAERVFVVKVKLEVKLFGSSIRTHEDDRKRPPRRLAALHDDGEPVEQRHEDDGEVGAEADDVGHWAGHWGPEFDTSASSITLTYSSNPCYENALYDPSCTGYAEALPVPK